MPDREPKHRHSVNRLERAVSLGSALLLAAAIAYLAWSWARPDDAPSFEAQVLETRHAGGGHHVRIEARNVGDQSVQNLRMRVEARDGDAVVADAETQLSWLPARSSRQAAVVLPVDPAGLVLEVVFLGYELP